MERTFWLRQKLRGHDQAWRDRINAVYNDPDKTDAEKAAEIEAIEMPEYLDIDEQSTKTTLMKRGGNG